APALSIRMMFRGGSTAIPKGKEGAAALMADLLTQGTEKLKANELQEQIDFLGASLSAGAAQDYISASLDCLSKDTAKGLVLLSDVLRHPTFPQEEFDRRRALMLTGLESLADDPGSLA